MNLIITDELEQSKPGTIVVSSREMEQLKKLLTKWGVDFEIVDAAQQCVEWTPVDIGDGCMVDPLILAAILPE